MVTRDFADKLLAAAGQPSLRELEKQIDADLKPRSRELKGWTLSADRSPSIATRSRPRTSSACWKGPGRTPTRRSSSAATTTTWAAAACCRARSRCSRATSTTGPMTTPRARRWCSSWPAAWAPAATRRRAGVVFMAFSGEERGLLGSQYYVEHPLFPLNETVMMVNCDMVGRLNDKNELTMIGTGTSPGFDALVEALGKSAGLKIKKVAGMTDGFGGSDHQSFYPKGIPVLFAFTGVHRDYHRPSDDSDRINLRGHGPDRRLPGAAPARRDPPARAAGVRQACRRAARRPAAADPARSGLVGLPGHHARLRRRQARTG